MEKRGLSQEGLKTVACVTMLLDHVGFLLGSLQLRAAGRIAFPIYCFLLAEGARHTGNPKKYALRLLMGALLSELPYDVYFFGRMTLAHQSVMVTLLIGYGVLYGMQRFRWPLIPAAAGVLLAELLHTDYGGAGVLMCCIFALTPKRNQRGIQLAALGLCAFLMGGYRVRILGVMLPLELLAVLAVVPIWCYSGEKRTRSKGIQRAFYLFYPLHLMLLILVREILIRIL